MSNKVNIGELADFYINYCKENAISINHLKLQKLLYYTQGWYLAYFDNELLFDELPQAWVNGPVYVSIYNTYKKQVRNEEIFYSGKLDYNDQLRTLNLNENQQDFILALLQNYASMSHETLVMLTHREKPWNDARKGTQPLELSNHIITQESMYEYFSSIIKSKNKS